MRLVERQHGTGASSAEYSLLGSAFFAFRSPRVPRNNDGSRRDQVHRSCLIPSTECATDYRWTREHYVHAGLKLICSGQESVIADYELVKRTRDATRKVRRSPGYVGRVLRLGLDYLRGQGRAALLLRRRHAQRRIIKARLPSSLGTICGLKSKVWPVPSSGDCGDGRDTPWVRVTVQVCTLSQWPSQRL